VRQEWAKLRDRNEALDCAVLARAALWLLGADRYGERFWQRLREDIANAPVESRLAESAAPIGTRQWMNARRAIAHRSFCPIQA